MSRFSKIMITLLLLLTLGFYWFLVDAGPGDVPTRNIDLAQIRKQANALPGQKPTALEYTTIATRSIAGAVLAAGTGLRPVQSGVIVWHIITPNSSIVIDSGLTQADAKDLDFDDFNADAAALVENWLDAAKLIVFTHEHIDHVGGFLDHPKFDAIASKAIVSPDIARGMTSLWKENASRLPKPRELEAIDAVAPGVVLIQTPGHSIGSQMIYVQLQSGREYIFAGDTGTLANNIVQTLPRSRLLTDWLVQEDRAATIGWLKGLGNLRKLNKSLVVIPSHDPQFLASSASLDGFTQARLPSR